MAGRYLPIPSTYSADLSNMIKRLLGNTLAVHWQSLNMLLVTDAKKRPSVAEILESSSVKKRLHLLPAELHQYLNRPHVPNSKVFKTIKVPRNLGMLQQNLPVQYSLQRAVI
jgi:hypothetical protein